tara:strand:- start:1869 stop:3122 length:1254 start_codon:yes stop_codon:yes gene_type:complete
MKISKRRSIWLPTRVEGLRRLETFLPYAGREYARFRNFDDGPGRHVHVSTLSPWIRHRLLPETEVVSAVLKRHNFPDTEKFIQEVFWRTYWKGWLELRPGVWQSYQSDLEQLIDRLKRDDEFQIRFSRATSGETGVQCFDEWANELAEHGYLHNHSRMWFASIWIFWLGLPWQLGADFFLRNLLDGDPAANTLSWRWVAGLQTRGKAYIARPENIAKFTRGRFRPKDGVLVEAPPISGPPDPTPRQIDARTDWNRTRRTGLLLTEDDLSPEFLGFPVNGFEGFATLNSSQGRSPLGVSNTVSAFVDGAFNDTLGRIRSVAGRPTGHVLQTSSVDNLVDWARRVQIEQFVTPYSPVGPVQDALDILECKLAPLGIALLRIIRPSDATAWPKATHGFFRFRKIIPSLIRQNGRGMETVR